MPKKNWQGDGGNLVMVKSEYKTCTRCSVHSHVSKVTALYNLHCQSPCRTVICKTQEKFWHSAMLKGLCGRSTVTTRQAVDICIGITLLKSTQTRILHGFYSNNIMPHWPEIYKMQIFWTDVSRLYNIFYLQCVCVMYYSVIWA